LGVAFDVASGWMVCVENLLASSICTNTALAS